MTKTKVDPIFAAIEAHKAAEKKWLAVATILDRKEHAAAKKIGRDPHYAVPWRNFAVEQSSVREKRDLFLKRGEVSPRLIRAEYLDALERCRAQARLADSWARRAGVTKLRRQLEAGIAQEQIVSDRLSRIRPTTAASAAALIEYASAAFEYDSPLGWQVRALKTAVAALKAMEARS
jgi:hypothetical protein